MEVLFRIAFERVLVFDFGLFPIAQFFQRFSQIVMMDAIVRLFFQNRAELFNLRFQIKLCQIPAFLLQLVEAASSSSTSCGLGLVSSSAAGCSGTMSSSVSSGLMI